jgi:hypothetical protein
MWYGDVTVFKCFMWMVLCIQKHRFMNSGHTEHFATLHILFHSDCSYIQRLIFFVLVCVLRFENLHCLSILSLLYTLLFMMSVTIPLLSIAQYHCVLIKIIFTLLSIHNDTELLYEGMRVALSRSLREQEFPYTLCTWKWLWKLFPECYGFLIWTRTMHKVQINSFKHYSL